MEPGDEYTRSRGVVKWFDWSKKFGFIADIDSVGPDVFVHLSDLRPTGPTPNEGHGLGPTLYTGEYVEYDVVPSDSQHTGTKAGAVTGIGGGPLLCESGILTFKSYTRKQFNSASS